MKKILSIFLGCSILLQAQEADEEITVLPYDDQQGVLERGIPLLLEEHLGKTQKKDKLSSGVRAGLYATAGVCMATGVALFALSADHEFDAVISPPSKVLLGVTSIALGVGIGGCALISGNWFETFIPNSVHKKRADVIVV